MAKKVVKKAAKKTAKKVTAKKSAKKASPKASSKKTVKKEASSKGGKKATTTKKVQVAAKKSVKMKTAAVKTEAKKEIQDPSNKVASGKKHPEEKKVTTAKKGRKKSKENLTEEILNLTDEYSFDEVLDAINQVDFLEGQTDECLIKNCDNPATTGLYCRLCYIKFWDSIKKKENILSENKLQTLIGEIVKKYPIKYVEEILKDLSDEKSFFSILKEMNIDAGEEAFEDAEEANEDDQDLSFEAKSASRSFSE